jgi:hypothetical protein
MITKIKLLLIDKLLRKEKETMAKVYATLIIKGKLKFSEVADTQKEKVRQVLIDLECEELLNM